MLRRQIVWLPYLLILYGVPASAVESAKTNILFILADDMGWQDTSVPFHNVRTKWNDRYRTPALERLAREGMKFTQAYSCAVCTPTRVSFLTGTNEARHGVTEWTHLSGDAPTTDRLHPLLSHAAWNWNGLQPTPGLAHSITLPVLPSLLRAAGYKTMQFGKGHFGAGGTPGEDPMVFGFERRMGGRFSGGCGSYWGTKHFGAKNNPSSPFRAWDLDHYFGQDIHLTEALTLEAKREIRAAVESKQPFFCYFAHYAPHTPIEPDKRFTQYYKAVGLDDTEAAYASLLEGMDKSVGDLLDLLEELKVADNTLVVFTSDNGGVSHEYRSMDPPHTHNKPLSSGKGSHHEGGIRVPLLVRWPNVVQAATVHHRPVIIYDWFPTLLRAGGADVPVDVDGIDLKPLLEGNDDPAFDRSLVWHFPNFWGGLNHDGPRQGPGLGPCSAIRKDDWKLIYYHTDHRFELFNLADDLGEENDLSSKNSKQLRALAAELSETLRQHASPMPIVKTTEQPVPLPIDALPAAERPRLAVLTDIGGDPDDQQSLIRLMAYANEFDIEAIVASAAGTRGELQKAMTRPELVREIINAYRLVLPKLKRHAEGWPEAEQLLGVVKSGNPQRERAHIGAEHDTEGSRFLIERIDAGTPQRPLNIAIWGGQTDLAQALWRVKQERGVEGLAVFVKKFRVYDISDQDGLADWMRSEFPGMNYLLAKAPPGRDKREGTYRGMYLTGDETLTSREWIETNIRSSGPLGALYPTKTFTAPNIHACLKEGDTPSWFFFLPLGGNDPADPTKPGWGGQYQREPDGWWRDIPAKEGSDPRSSVSKWREDFQADFARRMSWCRAHDPADTGTTKNDSFKLSAHHARACLLAPDGKPFIPLGINHLNVAVSKASVVDKADRLVQIDRDMRDWHFNTVGYGAPPELWTKFPFIVELSLTHCSHYLGNDRFAYDDVFDPAFQARVRKQIADLCAKTRGNSNCIGYWWTDTPRWDLEIAERLYGKTWVSSIRALPDDAPGKRRYAEFLRGPGPHDDRAFLRLIARELYSVTAAGFKQHDPQRLIFGERYKLGDHPPEVLAEAVRFVDVISIQPGPEIGPLAGPGREEREFDTARFDALYAITGKPILICDHQVSFHDPASPITLWHQFSTQIEAADSYEAFITDAFARPYIIGYFRCQYWNQWMPAPRSLLKQGLRQSDGQPYAEIVTRVAEINARLKKRVSILERQNTP